MLTDVGILLAGLGICAAGMAYAWEQLRRGRWWTGRAETKPEPPTTETWELFG